MPHQSINKSPDTSVAPASSTEKMGAFFRRRGALLTLLSAGSCTPGEIGQDVRPNDLTAAQGLDEESCTIREDRKDPLIVDWKDHQRDNLEIAMKKGVVVVSYDCETLRILPDCTVDSSYSFTPTTTKERVISLGNRDELKANLPTFGSQIGMKLGAELDRDTTLDIALVSVGRIMTSRSNISENLLQGNCYEATHFVQGATVGAFAMQTGTKGQVKTAAQLFGAGVSAASSSEKKVSAKNGDFEACQKATTEMTKPPSNCAAPLRLHLKDINRDIPEESTEATGDCPEGLVMSEIGCTKKEKSVPQCKEGDVKGCTEQCESGHMESCDKLGNTYRYAKGVPRSYKKAAKFYREACGGGLPLACDNLGDMYREGKGVPKSYRNAVKLHKKACNGGIPAGCDSLGDMYAEGKGVPKNKRYAKNLYRKAIRLYKKTCGEGDMRDCSNFGYMYAEGKGVPRSYKKAVKLFKKACDRGSSWGCAYLARAYLKGKGVAKNRSKGIELYQKACDLGYSEVCSALRKMGE